MKKITIMALALFLYGSVFAAMTFPEHDGSVKAHKKLTTKVFKMLLDGQYNQAKEFLESIKQCPKGTIKKSQIPAYCASSGLDYRWYGSWVYSVVNVESDIEPGFVFRDYKLNTVEPDAILYDALRTHYRYLAGNNPDAPGAFDKKKSTQLYNTYKDTWLGSLVKKYVLFSWPTVGEQYTTTSHSREGAKLYDQVALVQALNFTINDVMDNYILSCDSISETEQMLNAVSRRAQEVNDNKPAVAIKRKIFEDILDPEQYKEFLEMGMGDCRSRALAIYTSALGAEQEKKATHAWKVLAAKPFTKTMKKNAPKLYQFCVDHKDGYGMRRVNMKKIWCDNFAKNAKKYGLMEPNAADVRSMIRDKFQRE